VISTNLFDFGGDPVQVTLFGLLLPCGDLRCLSAVSVSVVFSLETCMRTLLRYVLNYCELLIGKTYRTFPPQLQSVQKSELQPISTVKTCFITFGI